MVFGDEVRLTQVFANLLNNAAKYTDPGGRIDVSVRKSGQTVVVTVRDSGIGIDREHLAVGVRHVHPGVAVEPAHPGRPRHRPDAGAQPGGAARRVGHGVERRVRAVAARSKCGCRSSPRRCQPHDGTAVLRRFPQRACPGGRRQPATPPRRCRALLESLGAIVVAAGSGREALGVFEAFEPDAVLLDIGMPGMDGYEVARRIRALPSGHGDADHRAHGMGPAGRHPPLHAGGLRPSHGEAARRGKAVGTHRRAAAGGELDGLRAQG